MDSALQLALPFLDLFSATPFVEHSAAGSAATSSGFSAQPPVRLPRLSNPPPLDLQQSGVRPVRVAIGQAQQLIPYQLKRVKRRTIGFMIDDRGLTVSAPKWVSFSEIDAAVTEKSLWISRKLVEWRKHQERRSANQIQWIDGGSLQYLGRAITMRVTSGITGCHLQDSGELLVGLAKNADASRLRDIVQAFLQMQAKRIFNERLERLAMLTGKAPNSWKLSSARTRWGSCTSDGSIRLNWRLIHFPMDVIDYVVTHELAHLSEMNHSPRFWNKVAQAMPDYESARQVLSQYPDDFGLA